MNPRWFSSLLLVVFENHGFSEVAGLSSHARIGQSPHGAVHMAWNDIIHPSGPNYRSLVAGDYWRTDEFIDEPHDCLASALDGIGIHTVVVSYAGDPAARHDPYLDLHAPTNRVSRAAFETALTLPNLLTTTHFYLGLDDSNNAHSAPLDVADRNLMTLLDQLDASPWFNAADADGKYPVLFIVWDEVYNADEHVFAAWYGKGVKPGLYPTYRNHYSFCATVCANYGLSPLNHAAGLAPIDEVWA